MESSRNHLFFVLILAISVFGSRADEDFPSCTKYDYAGLDNEGYDPISYPLNSLRNNVARADELFKGRFYLNTESYGDTYVSFKPIGEYAEGEEYQLSKYSTIIE